MRTLLAMFFSLVLIASQASFLNGGADFAIQSAAASKSCCGAGKCCQDRSCCTANNDSSPERSNPAVPSRGISRSDCQLAAAVVVAALPEPAAEPFASDTFSFVPLSPAAPLYQRNCSYLI